MVGYVPCILEMRNAYRMKTSVDFRIILKRFAKNRVRGYWFLSIVSGYI